MQWIGEVDGTDRRVPNTHPLPQRTERYRKTHTGRPNLILSLLYYILYETDIICDVEMLGNFRDRADWAGESVIYHPDRLLHDMWLSSQALIAGAWFSVCSLIGTIYILIHTTCQCGLHFSWEWRYTLISWISRGQSVVLLFSDVECIHYIEICWSEQPWFLRRTL